MDKSKMEATKIFCIAFEAIGVLVLAVCMVALLAFGRDCSEIVKSDLSFMLGIFGIYGSKSCVEHVYMGKNGDFRDRKINPETVADTVETIANVAQNVSSGDMVSAIKTAGDAIQKQIDNSQTSNNEPQSDNQTGPTMGSN